MNLTAVLPTPLAAPRLGSRSLPRPTVATWVGLGVAGCWATLSIARHAAFGSSYDLAIFHQGLTSPGFEVLIKGPGRSIFGDHFHPVILVLWPLLKLWPSPVALLVAQAVCIGLAVAVVGHGFEASVPLGWRRLWWAALVTAPGIQGAATHDFHEVALGAPLIAAALVALHRRRHWAALGWALALLLVKEDCFLFTGGIAVVLIAQGARRRGLALGTAAGAWWLLVSKVLIPHFAGGDYTYTSMLPSSAGQVAGNLIGSLLGPLGVTLLVISGAFGFRCWRSPLVVVTLPFLAAVAITDNWRLHTCFNHYFLLPTLVLAAAAAAATTRPAHWRPRPALRRVAAGLVVLSALCGPATVRAVTLDWNQAAGAEAALAQVPDGAVVATEPALTSHLVGRAQVRLADASWRQQPTADVGWVVLNRHSDAWGGGWASGFIEQLTRSGFAVVHDEAGWVVLQRVSAGGR